MADAALSGSAPSGSAPSGSAQDVGKLANATAEPAAAKDGGEQALDEQDGDGAALSESIKALSAMAGAREERLVRAQEGGAEASNFACEFCPKQYVNKYDLRTHVQSFHQGRRFVCKDCGKEFNYKSLLKRHMQCVHRQVKFECSECESAFSDKSSLSKHHKTAHEGKRYICSLCDKTFAFSNGLRAHIQSSHEGKRFKCPLCDIETTKKCNLAKHIKRFHVGKAPKLQQRFTCALCGKVFNLKGKLTQHQRVHRQHESAAARQHGDDLGNADRAADAQVIPEKAASLGARHNEELAHQAGQGHIDEQVEGQLTNKAPLDVQAGRGEAKRAAGATLKKRRPEGGLEADKPSKSLKVRKPLDGPSPNPTCALGRSPDAKAHQGAPPALAHAESDEHSSVGHDHDEYQGEV